MSAEKVVNELSNQIMLDLNILANEQAFPNQDADISKARIAKLQNRIELMRQMRDDYENIQSRVAIND